MIDSKEAFENPKINLNIEVDTALSGSIISSGTTVKYNQVITQESINNTIRRNFVDLKVARTNFISIRDVNAIFDDINNSVNKISGYEIAQIIEVLILAGQYIGAYIVPPTQREDGSALQDGDMIFDRFYRTFRTYDYVNTNWDTYLFQSHPDYFRSGLIATQTSTTSFSIPYNMTTLYGESVRIRFVDDTGDVILYGTVLTSVFDSINNKTDITVSMDSGTIPANLKYADISNIPQVGWTEVVTPIITPLISSAGGRIGSTEFFFAGSLAGELLMSNDGTNWTDVTSTLPASVGANKIINLSYSPFFESFVFSANNNIYRTTDGSTWVEIVTNDLFEYDSAVLYDDSGETLLYVTSGGSDSAPAGVLKWSYDNGNTFTYTSSGSYRYNYAIDLSISQFNDHIISVKTGSKQCYSANSYGNFRSLTSSYVPYDYITTVESLDINGVVVAGLNGKLLMTTDNSAVDYTGWTEIDAGFGTSNINDLYFNDTFGVLLAVSQHGKIATSYDYGLTWTQRANPFSIIENINNISYNKSAILYLAVGDNGKIAISSNGVT